MLAGKRVLISGEGRSAISQALYASLRAVGVDVFYRDIDPIRDYHIAICTRGMIIVDAPHMINGVQLDMLHRMNYAYPRQFVEDAIKEMVEKHIHGQIVVIGSVAARYGNVNAEDYAAYKAALNKYIELRSRTARDYGIRLSVLNLGAVATDFWKDTKVDLALAQGIVPDMSKALTADEVAETVVSLLNLPDRITIKDATVVSVAYQ